MTHAPGLSPFLKRLGGFSDKRLAPAFAPETFRAWFKRERSGRARSGPTIVLWPDTFNNYFTPRTPQAAVEVLESAGYRVHLPAGNVLWPPAV